MRESLHGEVVTFWKRPGWAIAGIIPTAAFLGSPSAFDWFTGSPSWILPLQLAILSTAPVLKYTRLAKFTRRYCDLAESEFCVPEVKFVAINEVPYSAGTLDSAGTD